MLENDYLLVLEFCIKPTKQLTYRPTQITSSICFFSGLKKEKIREPVLYKSALLEAPHTVCAEIILFNLA